MKALVFEPNPYHYEILPGFVKYLIDIGYEVDILEHRHEDFGDEFVYFQSYIHRYYYNDDEEIDKLREITTSVEYDLIFVTSVDYIKNKQREDILSRVYQMVDSKKVIACCHDLCNVIFEPEKKLLRDGKLITLTEYEWDGSITKMVNPHYFGEYECNHKKNSVCRIINIGVSSARFNVEYALDTLKADISRVELCYVGRYNQKELDRKYYIEKVFYPLCKFFGIKRYNALNYRPASFKTRKLTKFLGALSFEQMFNEVIKSDFLLMDLTNYCDEFFTSKTSGTKQLSLGFNTPCIVSEKVAKAYGFDETNAILFKEGELENAIQRAIDMTDDEYMTMKESLKKFQNKVYTKSKGNLQSILKS